MQRTPGLTRVPFGRGCRPVEGRNREMTGKPPVQQAAMSLPPPPAWEGGRCPVVRRVGVLRRGKLYYERHACATRSRV